MGGNWFTEAATGSALSEKMLLKTLQTSPVSETPLNKFEDLRPTSLLKRRFRQSCFLMNFEKFQLFYTTLPEDGCFWI